MALFVAKRRRAVPVAFAPVLADGHRGRLKLSERLQAFLVVPLFTDLPRGSEPVEKLDPGTLMAP